MTFSALHFPQGILASGALGIGVGVGRPQPAAARCRKASNCTKSRFRVCQNNGECIRVKNVDTGRWACVFIDECPAASWRTVRSAWAVSAHLPRAAVTRPPTPASQGRCVVAAREPVPPPRSLPARHRGPHVPRLAGRWPRGLQKAEGHQDRGPGDRWRERINARHHQARLEQRW